MSIDQNVNYLAISLFCKNDKNHEIHDSHQQFLYSLKPIKSVNHYWNKTVAKLKSKIASLEVILENNIKKQFLTDYTINQLKNTVKKLKNNIRQKTKYRNNFIENYTHQITTKLLNQLSENVDVIIYGKNVNFKKESNLGKVNNQNFVQIPFNKIINKLNYKAILKGIYFIVVEESYTSKTSFLDKETLFNYENNKPPKKYQFLGKRIKRGLFKTATNCYIHADINATLNIARKVIGEKIYQLVDLTTIMGSSPKKVKIRF